MFLIEKDKRGLSVKLAYENPENPFDRFSIPENVFLIGTSLSKPTRLSIKLIK